MHGLKSNRGRLHGDGGAVRGGTCRSGWWLGSLPTHATLLSVAIAIGAWRTKSIGCLTRLPQGRELYVAAANVGQGGDPAPPRMALKARRLEARWKHRYLLKVLTALICDRPISLEAKTLTVLRGQ